MLLLVTYLVFTASRICWRTLLGGYDALGTGQLTADKYEAVFLHQRQIM